MKRGIELKLVGKGKNERLACCIWGIDDDVKKLLQEEYRLSTHIFFLHFYALFNS